MVPVWDCHVPGSKLLRFGMVIPTFEKKSLYINNGKKPTIGSMTAALPPKKKTNGILDHLGKQKKMRMAKKKTT